MTPPVTVKREITIGEVLHTLALLAIVAVAYGQFTVKFDAYQKSVANVEESTSRIEHYLSSQDKDYWRKVARNGDARH